MNSHEVHVFENGSASIKNLGLAQGETMHSSMGPDLEAQVVYLEQTHLRQRLHANQPNPLVLYDIGLGIGTNALAAIELGLRSRDLHIVSFENDLTGLELALSRRDLFPRQDHHRNALSKLMRDQRWTSPDGRIRWELHYGNFENAPLSRSPEVIFYDFYSPKSSPELWTYQQFARLRQAIAGSQAAVLATYSAATSIRSALLLAGFYVGEGKPTVLKTQTTIASTRLSELENPLGRKWLEHLDRSSRGFPPDIEDLKKARESLETHPQFNPPLRKAEI